MAPDDPRRKAVKPARTAIVDGTFAEDRGTLTIAIRAAPHLQAKEDKPMSKTHSPVREAPISTTLDTFLAISRSYFACAERVTAVNFATVRQALADCSGAGYAMLHATDAQPEKAVPLTHAVDRTFDYTRAVYEIIADTQEQVGQLMTREISDFQDRLANPDSWRTAFGMFTSGTTWPLSALSARAPRSETSAEPPASDAVHDAHDAHRAHAAHLTRKAA